MIEYHHGDKSENYSMTSICCIGEIAECTGKRTKTCSLYKIWLHWIIDKIDHDSRKL